MRQLKIKTKTDDATRDERTGAGLSGDELAAFLAEAVPDAGLLELLDPASLSGAGRVDALVAMERLQRRAQAMSVRVLGAMAADPEVPEGVEADGEWVRSSQAGEVAAALCLHGSAARERLECAAALTQRHGAVVDLLAAGEIHLRQAEAVAELTRELDDETAARVQDAVIGKLAGRTPSSTRQVLRRAVAKADPQAAERRHETAKKHRRVQVRPEEDGMATLELYTTAELAAALKAAVDAIATKKTPGDARCLDQRRADTFAALILGGGGGAGEGAPSSPVPAALVHVVVGLDTLMGVGEDPGHLEGYGPITAAVVRRLAFAAGSVWKRLITCPDTGTLVKADPTTYRPTADTERLVRSRDRVCSFPSCSMPARRCDLDHADPFRRSRPRSGGATVKVNLHPLCRRHHILKTLGLWDVKLDRHGRVKHWTAPTGHRYTTTATDYRDLI